MKIKTMIFVGMTAISISGVIHASPSATPTPTASSFPTAASISSKYLKIGLPPTEVETQKIVVDEINGRKRITTWRRSISDPNHPGEKGNGVWYPVNSIVPQMNGTNMVIQTGVDINQNRAQGVASPAPYRSMAVPEPSAGETTEPF